MREQRDFKKEELAWIKKFESVMTEAPKTLFMFVGGSCGSCTIYPKDENNNRYMEPIRSGGVTHCTHYRAIKSPMEMDGGDW